MGAINMKNTTREYAEVVKNLAGFLDFVQNHCTEFDDVLFRGQKEDWPLLPKLARLRFRGELAVREAEARMLTSLRTRALPYLDTVPQNDWDWLTIAQHYGMATRLLDWSTNPLAALWFAVEQPARKNQDAVIWVFTPSQDDHVANPDSSSPFNSDRTRVFMPKHINRRIVAQHGWFTVHYIRKTDSKFVPLEKNERYTKSLMKLRIPAQSFPSIRTELDRCGINAATLYGDLVGLCRDSEWQHSLLDDEDVD
ncbi:MAG: FRG domain-containing protein [Limnobacter sp.]